MTPAIALLTIAGILLVSGFKNQSVVDTFLGRERRKSTGNVPDVPDAPASTASSGGGGTGNANVAALFSEMDRMANLNLPYKWGGGHGGYDADGPWDCSGAVSQALHVAGFLKGAPRVSGGFMAWGRAGRGAEFTVYASPLHVFIRDEHTGRDWGTTKSTGHGGPAWHHHSTAGFVARHSEAGTPDLSQFAPLQSTPAHSNAPAQRKGL